ncbi:hypothetical protein [Tenacibaculum phage Larrie]|nr:hypothetical protein [Tenacibaculum phage Larrie]
MCTELDLKIKKVKELSEELISEVYTFDGVTYCPKYLGYKTIIMDSSKSLGRCHVGLKEIQLSSFYINSLVFDLDTWKDIILHEIAHAIDFKVRGRSNHDKFWKRIAVSVGAKPKSTTDVVYRQDLKQTEKYTIICDNCGNSRPSKRHSPAVVRGSRACNICCDKHNNGKFSKDYLLKQIKNY